jgi:hypothetical protein
MMKMMMMMKKILADLIGSSCKDKICTKSSCSSFLHSSQKWILLQKTKEVQKQQQKNNKKYCEVTYPN